MGRKSKLGKRRKDKFYHLAKETGYRARSAFKLIQLNRKYQFLQQSRVLVDLCAAPGGWLQVAAKHMPVSSLIVGVDLVPIKPIPNVITLQEDITSSRCKQQLQKELKTWKADCILNDGAPNVGAAWVQDAFSQATLTLAAMKLACELLREGGWFITKLFRSKDYQSLMWVFQQLFKKVHSTKPQASRIESAEIFVVCQGYLAPGKIDPKLLDAKHVFQEVEEEGKKEQKVSLARLQKPPKAAEGYPDDARMLFTRTSVADFIMGGDHLTQLAATNQLLFDKPSEVFAKHPSTTADIRQLCEDVKVLGPRELKQLVKWRAAMRTFLEEVGSDGEEKEGDKVEVKKDDLSRADARVGELLVEEAAEAKRERRRLRKVKRRIKERLVQRAELHREAGEITRQEELFKLKDIRSRSQLKEVGRGKMVAMEMSAGSGDEEKEEGEIDSEGEELMSEESESEEEGEGGGEEGGSDGEEEEEGEEEEVNSDAANPLVVPLESAAAVRSRKARLWFSKSEFSGLEQERDEDEEIRHAVKSYESKGGRLVQRKAEESLDGATALRDSAASGRRTADSGEGESESDSGIEEMTARKRPRIEPAKSVGKGVESHMDDSDSSDSDSDEEGAGHNAAAGDQVEGDIGGDLSEGRSNRVRKLDPEGLALGALIIQSRKKREDLIESAFNRWSHNDEGLPVWFVEEENKYYQKQLPVTKEMVQEYRARLREMNARPIKKIAEAKARKKHRALKKLERARKKAETVTDAVDVSSHEKMQQVRAIYKRAGLLGRQKKEVQYVVAKKSGGRRARPAGIKGRYKMVDPRMKKDLRGGRDAKKEKKQRQHKPMRKR